jgi:hypothetical protein
MKDDPIPQQLREALLVARALGCSVEPIPRTGELMIGHPAVLHRCRISGRRKDTPKRLLSFLRRVKEAL